jgi:ribosome maturation factor RimP
MAHARRRDDGEKGVGVDGTSDLENAFAPICASFGVDLVDVELASGTLQVTVERPEGIDLDAVAEINRVLSAFLDVHDDLAPSGRYELEVGTPGLERRLRRPQHFRRAVGETISVRTLAGTPGDRRVEGILESVDDDGIVVVTSGDRRVIEFAQIERARTVFDWQAALRSPAVSAIAEHDGERVEETKTVREAGR